MGSEREARVPFHGRRGPRVHRRGRPACATYVHEWQRASRRPFASFESASPDSACIQSAHEFAMGQQHGTRAASRRKAFSRQHCKKQQESEHSLLLQRGEMVDWSAGTPMGTGDADLQG
jgi:hypothetical protein